MGCVVRRVITHLFPSNIALTLVSSYTRFIHPYSHLRYSCVPCKSVLVNIQRELSSIHSSNHSSSVLFRAYPGLLSRASRVYLLCHSSLSSRVLRFLHTMRALPCALFLFQALASSSSFTALFSSSLASSTPLPRCFVLSFTQLNHRRPLRVVRSSLTDLDAGRKGCERGSHLAGASRLLFLLLFELLLGSDLLLSALHVALSALLFSCLRVLLRFLAPLLHL